MPSILSAVFVACCSDRHSLRARDDWVQNQPLLLPCCLQQECFERRGHGGRSFYLTSTPVKQWRNISLQDIKTTYLHGGSWSFQGVTLFLIKGSKRSSPLHDKRRPPGVVLAIELGIALATMQPLHISWTRMFFLIFLAVLRKLHHYCPKGCKVALARNGVRFKKLMLPSFKQRNKTVIRQYLNIILEVPQDTKQCREKDWLCPLGTYCEGFSTLSFSPECNILGKIHDDSTPKTNQLEFTYHSFCYLPWEWQKIC